MVSTGNNLGTIVVANRLGRQAVVFSRVGRALERRNVVVSEDPPDSEVSTYQANEIAFSGRQCEPIRKDLSCTVRFGFEIKSSKPALFRSFPNAVTEEVICQAPRIATIDLHRASHRNRILEGSKTKNKPMSRKAGRVNYPQNNHIGVGRS